MLPSLAALTLQADAGQEQAMQDGFSMLCQAAQDNDLERVRDLLNSGARVDKAPHKTPLMIASKNGHTEIVRLLLEHGAKVDRTSNDGNTPLVIASEEGHTEIVKLLLFRFAKVDKPDRDGLTPLQIANAEGHFEIFILLIEHGADVNKIKRLYSNLRGQEAITANKLWRWPEAKLARSRYLRRRWRGLFLGTSFWRHYYWRAVHRVYTPGQPGYNEYFYDNQMMPLTI